jgi:hypothetical protein
VTLHLIHGPHRYSVALADGQQLSSHISGSLANINSAVVIKDFKLPSIFTIKVIETKGNQQNIS